MTEVEIKGWLYIQEFTDKVSFVEYDGDDFPFGANTAPIVQVTLSAACPDYNKGELIYNAKLHNLEKDLELKQTEAYVIQEKIKELTALPAPKPEEPLVESDRPFPLEDIPIPFTFDDDDIPF